MLGDIERAKIVITNYHAFKLRERLEVAKGGRALLAGPRRTDLQTLETEGQMLQRVMPELMGMKNILVINDEAHHCYREKPTEAEAELEDLKGDDKDEAKKNNEAARLWISGIEAVKRKLGRAAGLRPVRHAVLPARLGLRRGHAVPLDDERLLADGRHRVRHREAAARAGGGQHPRRRHAEVPQPVGAHRQAHAEEGAGQGRQARPARACRPSCRPRWRPCTATTQKTFELWQAAGHRGAARVHRGLQQHGDLEAGLRLHLRLRARRDDGRHRARSKTAVWSSSATSTSTATAGPPRTLLIDSEQLESGEALDDNFRDMAADEIERFRREIMERTGDRAAAENITDQDLLREVMNTVGKPGRLGEPIRCVVSVSMLTEGWDANTVTHVLGVRAFGTQLLCEQVVGRALRRQSYDLNEDGLFNVEYADVWASPSTSRPSRWSRRRKPPREDRSRPGDAARARRAGDPLPAGRGLPGRAAGRAPDRRASTTTRSWS